MSLIGQFNRTKSGYAGRVRTLVIDAELVLVPAEHSDAENAPDYRIHLGAGDGGEVGPEVGAAWKRTGEKAGAYLAMQIDDPTFGHPIRANFFQSGDDTSAWGLNWNRPPKRAERD
jgi:uncharacterized protein (DUF736 family)